MTKKTAEGNEDQAEEKQVPVLLALAGVADWEIGPTKESACALSLKLVVENYDDVAAIRQLAGGRVVLRILPLQARLPAGGDEECQHPEGVRLGYTMFEQVCSNLRAIYLTLDGIRLSYVRGLGEVLINTVSQMLALPGAAYIDPYELLGVRPDAPIEVVEASYKALAKQQHPDAGGSEQGMKNLNEAIDRIRAEREKGAA